MNVFKKILCIYLTILFNTIFYSILLADNHNIYETLETIQKRYKTLERLFIQDLLVRHLVQMI